MRPGYLLKLNSYDLGVDIELADAVERLRFEHPEVRCVVLRSALDRVFCSGANIFMLAGSSHGFKVNFCKFTNETRLAIEDASFGERAAVSRCAFRSHGGAAVTSSPSRPMKSCWWTMGVPRSRFPRSPSSGSFPAPAG